jgi:hypothetical protein
LLRLLGVILYKTAGLILRNKLICLLAK